MKYNTTKYKGHSHIYEINEDKIGRTISTIGDDNHVHIISHGLVMYKNDHNHELES